MKAFSRDPRSPSDDIGRDTQIAAMLAPLDPATTDRGYWLRFQSRLMRAAAPELARRRMLPDLTMGDILTGWARAVVPTAVLAAAIAALALIQGWPIQLRPAGSVTLEEMLVAGMESETIPQALDEAAAESSISFAAERF